MKTKAVVIALTLGSGSALLVFGFNLTALWATWLVGVGLCIGILL